MQGGKHAKDRIESNETHTETQTGADRCDIELGPATNNWTSDKQLAKNTDSNNAQATKQATLTVQLPATQTQPRDVWTAAYLEGAHGRDHEGQPQRV